MSDLRVPRMVPMVTTVGLVLGLMLGLATPPLPAAEEELPLNFNAVAVNMSNVGPRGQARLQIRINRWSTEEERAKMMEALASQTGRARDRELADTLFGKESVGFIREQ